MNEEQEPKANAASIRKQKRRMKREKAKDGSAPRLSPAQSHPLYWREKPFVKREYPRTMALKRLFFLPEEMAKEEYKQLLGIFTPEDIPALVAILRDRRFAGSVIAYHALQFLNLKPMAQKLREKDVAYLMPLFNLANDLDDPGADDDDSWVDIVDTLTFVLRKAGTAALGPLKDFATDRTRSKSARSYTFECISGIGADGDENDRQQAINIFTEILKGYEKEDKETNAAIASGLCDLKAVEVLPLLRPMFADKLVDESYMGDWSDVLETMGLPIDTSDPLVRVCLHCGDANLVCRTKRAEESREKMHAAIKQADSLIETEKYLEAYQELSCALTCCEDWAARPGNYQHTIYQKRALCLFKLGRFREVIYDTTHEFWDGKRDNSPAMLQLRMRARAALSQFGKAAKDARVLLEQDPENVDAKRIIASVGSKKQAKPSPVPVSAPTHSYNWKKPQHVLKNNWSSPHLHEADEHPFCIGVAVAPDSFAYTSSCHSLTFKKIEIEEEADRALVNGGLNGNAALNGKRSNKNKTLAKKATKGMKKKINVDAGMALVVRGNQVAVGSNTDLRIRIWDIETNKVLVELGGCTIDKGHTHGISYIVFDEDMVLSAGHDKKVHIWDRQSGKLVNTLWGHTKTVHCIDYNRELSVAMTSSGDRVIREYDLNTGNLLRCFFGHSKGHGASKYNNPIGKVAFNKDRIVSASYSPANEVLIWCRQSGRVVQKLTYNDSWVTGLALTTCLHDDSGYAFLGMVNGDIHVISLYGAKCIATFKGDHIEAVVSLAVGVWDRDNKNTTTSTGEAATQTPSANGDNSKALVAKSTPPTNQNQSGLILTSAGMDGKVVTRLLEPTRRQAQLLIKGSAPAKGTTTTTPSTATTTNTPGADAADKKLEVCAGCGMKESTPKMFKCCGGCRRVNYCSVECQKNHWRSGHREACRSGKH